MGSHLGSQHPGKEGFINTSACRSTPPLARARVLSEGPHAWVSVIISNLL